VTVGVTLAPTGLAATATVSSVSLTWTDASSNEENFVVRRRNYQLSSATWSAWADVATLPAGTTSWLDSSVPGGLYQYSVVAKNWLGSKSTSSVNVRVGFPSAPTGLAAAVTDVDVTLSWTDTSSIEDSFVIERRDYDSVAATWGAYTAVQTVAEDTTSFVTTPPVGKFQYRVRAVNTAGSNVSSAVSVTFGVPQAPSAVVVAVAGRTVTVSWTDNSTTESAFVIERRSQGPGGWTAYADVGFVAANASTFVDNPGVGTYTYRIRATNVAGTKVSGASRKITVT
jgi:hypothetical protein